MVVTLNISVGFCAGVCSSVTFFLALSIPTVISNAELKVSIFSANSRHWMFSSLMPHAIWSLNKSFNDAPNLQYQGKERSSAMNLLTVSLHASFSCGICIIPQSLTVPGYSVRLRVSLALRNSSLQVSRGLINSSEASKVLVQLVIRVQSTFCLYWWFRWCPKIDQVSQHNASMAPA